MISVKYPFGLRILVRDFLRKIAYNIAPHALEIKSINRYEGEKNIYRLQANVRLVGGEHYGVLFCYMKANEIRTCCLNQIPNDYEHQ